MDINEYGPFANVVGIAAALTATFSVLLVRMIGNVKKWTWLADEPPPFFITFGARLVVVALMAITYFTINKSNYLLYGGGAVICACLGLYFLNRFNYLRKLHIVPIPLVAADGQQLRNSKNELQYKNLVIGREEDIKESAKTHFTAASEKRPGLTPVQFMSGYGETPNNPESMWSREVLVRISNKISMSLIYLFLIAVLVLYWAAFAIEVYMRTN